MARLSVSGSGGTVEASFRLSPAALRLGFSSETFVGVNENDARAAMRGWADALGRHKNVFDDLFRNMVAAGEAGGVLDEILMRLATYIEKADALKRKVQGAMVYPAVVLSVCVGAAAFMLIFIIPTFAKMFTDFLNNFKTESGTLSASRCWSR